MPVDGNDIARDLLEDSLGPYLRALDDRDIGPERLAKKLDEELDATEQKVVWDKKRGRFRYSKEMVAWKVRQDAREDAQKIMKFYPTEKVDHNVSGSVNINVTKFCEQDCRDKNPE